MMRRFWPAAVAVASIIVFGSYILLAQYLVREIRREQEIHARVYSIVQEAMLRSADDEEYALSAMLELQQIMQRGLNVPIIWLGPDGFPTAVANLPFEPDLASEEGVRRVMNHAARMKATRPDLTYALAGIGEVYFGESPLLAWLDWVPFLQVGAGALLVIITLFMIRADVRAHRERLWSAMARELAHQMGTPLSSLAGWTEVLQLPDAERETMADPERIGRVMQADVERLERVSRRFELIGRRQELTVTAVQDVVRELADYFRPRLPTLGKGVTLRTRMACDVPPVRANAVLLTWALENIVKNAMDALAGRGGRISVIVGMRAREVRRGVRRVHIIISDNGPGIAPSVRDRIFEPGVSTKSSGWGVGLSLSRRIVEDLHHGRITVRPRTGGGTVFDVWLPAAGS